MYVKIRKKTLVVFSILAGLTVAGLCAGLIALDITRKKEQTQHQADLAAGWRQSIAELSDALAELEIDLQKGLYASGDYQTVSWASQVFAQAGAARSALEALPVYELRLQGTETFLNQVGEFTLEMARKQLRGEDLSDTEESSLQRLALRSQELADEVLTMSERVADENPGYEQLRELLLPSEEGEDKTEFESLEEIFSGDDPLSYDGEHSSWRESRTSKWLETLSETGENELKELASNYLVVPADSLAETERFDKPFFFREFRTGETVIALTERGGLLYGLSRLREVEESKLSVEEALTMGGEGLAEFGYEDMEPVSWATAENTLTAVYVLRQNGVLVYSDRITVTIALDTGDIMSVNAIEYLLAHDPHRKSASSVSREQAAMVLRDDLVVEAYDLVSVPGGDGSERVCWQFTVHNDAETRVMIFVNANTKVEEEILILVEEEGFRKAI